MDSQTFQPAPGRSIELIQGDLFEWARIYDGPKFHAIMCDPPYHLTSITKRFGKPGAAPAKGDNYARLSRGFMNTTWDGGDIAFDPETWYLVAQHLYPGGFLMAFASSRGWHRLAVAIEDAGLVIHPSIFGWGFGSGFPKATRLDTQIDRQAGAERPVIGVRKHQPKFNAADLGYREKDNGFNSKDRETFEETGPATALAQAWAGHRYGLQAVKPALEPIIIAQRPYEGAPLRCITESGAGAYWIEGARIESPGESITINRFDNGARPWGDAAGEPYTSVESSGRWPANLVLMHSWRCDAGGCAEDCPARLLGEQSGESTSKQGKPREGANSQGWGMRLTGAEYGDSGTAARFFAQPDWSYEVAEAIAMADPVRYVPKPGAKERDAGLDQLDQVETLYITVEADEWENEGLKAVLLVDTATSPPKVIDVYTTLSRDVNEWSMFLFGNEPMGLFPLDSRFITGTMTNSTIDSKTLNWLTRSLTSESMADASSGMVSGGSPVPTAESSNPSISFTSEKTESLPIVGNVPSGARWSISAKKGRLVSDGRAKSIDNAYQRGETSRLNIHPTIKPIELAKWLATLLLPPERYAPERSIMIPFAGVASEVIGAYEAGWDRIVGIEREAEYIPVAAARVRFWTAPKPSPEASAALVELKAGIERLQQLSWLDDAADQAA